MVARRRRTRLAAARKAAGYTQEALAAALHVDRSTVIRWEAGQHAPVPYLWPKLAALLRLSREQLQFLLAGEALTLEDMRRRTLVKWGLATTAVASLSASAGTTVGMADVRRLQRATARLHSLDQQHGGDTLWQAALALANDGLQLLEYGSYTDTVGQPLLASTGELLTCAGWLALDAGQHDVARTCLTDALATSRQAGNVSVEIRALANLALQSNALSRPREALRYAAGAENAASALTTSWLAAIPQLRLAIASALVGNATDADHAIARARLTLDQRNDAETDEWSSFLSPFEIDGVEATCAIELQRPTRAERLLERAIAGYTQQCARNLALYRVRLSRARLEAGLVDASAEAAATALDDLSGEVASWRVSRELGAVARRLAEYRDIEGVEGFLVRYQAMRQ